MTFTRVCARLAKVPCFINSAPRFKNPAGKWPLRGNTICWLTNIRLTTVLWLQQTSLFLFYLSSQSLKKWCNAVYYGTTGQAGLPLHRALDRSFNETTYDGLPQRAKQQGEAERCVMSESADKPDDLEVFFFCFLFFLVQCISEMQPPTRSMWIKCIKSEWCSAQSLSHSFVGWDDTS